MGPLQTLSENLQTQDVDLKQRPIHFATWYISLAPWRAEAVLGVPGPDLLLSDWQGWAVVGVPGLLRDPGTSYSEDGSSTGKAVNARDVL